MSLGAAFVEVAKVVAKETADKALEAAAEVGKEATFELPKRFGEEAAAEYLPERIGEVLYPNTQFEIDGISYETDDFGNIFKVDGEIRPGTEYVLNGVEYRSDTYGQIFKVDEAESAIEGSGRDVLEPAKPELSAEEISQKQDRVIESVESGEIVLETNQEKGNYGEMKVDQDLREKGYERISTDVVTDLKDPTHKGIDGVYYNPDGDPPYLIVDAKYDTAKLKDEIGDGRQMSQKWIDARLDDAVGKDVADEIRMAQLNGDVGCYVGKVAKGGDLTAEVIYQQVDEAGEIVKGV